MNGSLGEALAKPMMEAMRLRASLVAIGEPIVHVASGVEFVVPENLERDPTDLIRKIRKI